MSNNSQKGFTVLTLLCVSTAIGQKYFGWKGATTFPIVLFAMFVFGAWAVQKDEP